MYYKNTEDFFLNLEIKINGNNPLFEIFTQEDRRLTEELVKRYRNTHHIIGFSSASGVCDIGINGVLFPIELKNARDGDEKRQFSLDPFYRQIAQFIEVGKRPENVIQFIKNWIPMGDDPTHRIGEGSNPRPVLFLIYGFDPSFENPIVSESIREMYNHFIAEWTGTETDIRQIKCGVPIVQTTKMVVIFVTTVRRIPSNLQRIIISMDLPLPSKEEIDNLVSYGIEKFRAGKPTLPLEIPDGIARTLKGLTMDEAGGLLNVAYTKCGRTIEESKIIPALIEGKQELLRHSGILTYTVPEEGLDSIGGLDNFKGILRRAKSSLSKEARKFGIRGKRAYLCCGVQGTGKSASGLAAANFFQIPLLTLDVGTVMNKFVGESEARMDGALMQASANAPCILRIDEINRHLSDTVSGDSGVSDRLKGKLLTFMQECKEDVIIMASGNDISRIAGEVIQRFNDIIFFDLPTEEERKEILSIHIEKVRTEGSKKRTAINYMIAVLAKATEGFTGREIERCITEAMEEAFAAGKDDYDTDDILNRIVQMVPLSVSHKTLITGLQEWALTRCVPATTNQSWEDKKLAALKYANTQQKIKEAEDKSRFSGLN